MLLLGGQVPQLRFVALGSLALGDVEKEPDWIEGSVSGDLSGAAGLELRPQRRGSVCSVAWDVEIADPKIRRVIHFARPVLLWAQRWAVEIALHGFRSHLHRR